MVEQKVIEFLEKLCAGRVYTGEAIHEDYTHDEMPEYGIHMPDVVVEVISTDEVSAIVRYANDNNIRWSPEAPGPAFAAAAWRYTGVY